LQLTWNQAAQKTGVAVVRPIQLDKDLSGPRWAALREPGKVDLQTTGALWTYPRGRYERVLVTQPTKKSFKESRSGLVDSAVTVVSQLAKYKLNSADVHLPRSFTQEQLELWLTSSVLANYKYSEKTEEEDKFDGVSSLNIMHRGAKDSQRLDYVLKAADATLYSRNLANVRGSAATPEYLANEAQKLAALSPKVTLKVLKGDELVTEGLNLLHAVGKGAACPAHLVVLEYKGNSEKTLSIVGKGVTFDTGGLNIKPTNYIEDMYLDKSGACNALAIAKWAVETNYPVNLTVVLALAENSVDQLAFKPSDIIKSYKGLTVEIGNTDAEGRLCLADALTYVQRHHKPHTIVDMATLTGACVVALGERTGGVFSNDAALTKSLIKSGAYFEEALWELPITSENEEALESTAADITNSGKSRYGGAGAAAAFLKKFIDEGTKWAHLDIAG
jgi:leucyl aminopeptidase